MEKAASVGGLPAFDMTIDKRVIAPPTGRNSGRAAQYLFDLMHPRESAVVNRSYQAVSKALDWYMKKPQAEGKAFKVRTLVKGKSCRVWRIK
jgi:hypothetical protein